MRGNLTASYTLNQILSESFQKRFWGKVKVYGPDECWPWKAARHNRGYGLVLLEKIKGRGILEFAHRAAWMIHNKEYPPSEKPFILHSCIGNPACCNPSHLRPGTAKENTDDMYRQSRESHKGAPGERNRNAKLTPGQVLEIRKRSNSGASTMELAKRFRMSRVHIWEITSRRSWKHI